MGIKYREIGVSSLVDKTRRPLLSLRQSMRCNKKGLQPVSNMSHSVVTLQRVTKFICLQTSRCLVLFRNLCLEHQSASLNIWSCFKLTIFILLQPYSFTQKSHYRIHLQGLFINKNVYILLTRHIRTTYMHPWLKSQRK